MLVISPSSASIHNPDSFNPRQTLLMGSEPMSSLTARKWAASHDNRNGYGSTETNTVATCHPFTPDTAHQCVGSGAAHQYWIVDPLNHDRLVPPGWLGEVLVEGHAMASEYVGNAEASQKAFPSAPKWYSEMRANRSHPTRFFKSGDLGRTGQNGTIEIHGRTDHLQVKLRGQRIELGEIESVTANCISGSTHLLAELVLLQEQDRPAIALFVVLPGVESETVTSPFMKPTSLSSPQKTELDNIRCQFDNAWKESLPRYMRPSYLIPLSALPRTSTRKLDRRGVRDWASKHTASDLHPFSTALTTGVRGVQSALQSEDEIKIGRVFSDILGVPLEELNANSSFTVLGGDSLSAIRAAKSLRGQGIDTSPQDVIKSDTLSALAQQIKSVQANGVGSRSSGYCHSHQYFDKSEILKKLYIRPDDVEDVLPTTDSQTRAIKLGTGPEKCFVFHFVLEFHGTIDQSRLLQAMQDLIQRHDILVTVFTQHGERIIQAMLKSFHRPVEHRELDNGEQLQGVVDSISTSNIEIDKRPTQFWLASTNYVPKALVLRLSHAQFDGLSVPIIWDDLIQLYFSQTLPTAPSFASYIRTVLEQNLERSKAYFKGLLGDVPFTDLVKRTTKLHVPQNRHFRRTLSIHPLPGFTPASLFEAAWGYVLAKNSHAQAVVFDQIVSGRQGHLPDDQDIQALVGACLNDVPVVVRFEKQQTVRQLLNAIRNQHAESAKHETLGFKHILVECKPDHWPSDARMTSSVQYRGFEAKTEFEDGGVRFVASMRERSMDLEDLTVLVTPSRDGEVGTFEVEFLFSDCTVRESDARRWLEELIDSVTALADDVAL